MSTEIEKLVKEYGGSVLEFDKLCRWLLTCLFFKSKSPSVFYRSTFIKCDGTNNTFNLIYSNYENALWKEKQISIVDYTKNLYGMECFTALEQVCILDLEDKKFISLEIARDINSWIDANHEELQTLQDCKT